MYAVIRGDPPSPIHTLTKAASNRSFVLVQDFYYSWKQAA